MMHCEYTGMIFSKSLADHCKWEECFKAKINSTGRYFESQVHIKEMKIADSV